MASEHQDHNPEAAYNDVNIRSIALVGGVGTVLVFVAAVAVQVIYFRYQDTEFRRKIVDVPVVAAVRSLEDQRTRITSAGPGAFPDAGEQRVPIEEAMKSVLAEYQARQSDDAGASDDAGRDQNPGDDASESAEQE